MLTGVQQTSLENTEHKTQAHTVIWCFARSIKDTSQSSICCRLIIPVRLEILALSQLRMLCYVTCYWKT